MSSSRKVGGSCSRRKNEGSERVEIFVNTARPTWRVGRRNKRKDCESQVCHRITCKDYKRKKYIHRVQERFKE